MLRVGLTGELGSGKSTVARLLAAHGAQIFSSDEIGRAMMRPGEPVFAAIVERFGPRVLAGDGQLDRTALAALAFDPAHPRVEELNGIVHPAVIAAQEELLRALAAAEPGAVAVVESALLLTTRHADGTDPWRSRFDAVVLVTAPDEVKLERFVARVAAGRALAPAALGQIRADGERRLAAQRIPAPMAARCLLVDNAGDLEALERAVDRLWRQLTQLPTTGLSAQVVRKGG